MPIGNLPADQKPLVQEHNGQIAVWAGHRKDPVGLVFSPEAGVSTGLDCLAVATQLLGRHVCLSNGLVALEEKVELDEDVAARLLIATDGVSFEIPLSATQVRELAASTGAMARNLG